MGILYDTRYCIHSDRIQYGSIRERDAMISLQLAGMTLIGGPSLESGRISSGVKKPTLTESDRYGQCLGMKSYRPFEDIIVNTDKQRIRTIHYLILKLNICNELIDV